MGSFKNKVCTIDITYDMKGWAWYFAEEIITGDNQYNRMLPEEAKNNKGLSDLIRIQRTYAGKLAECVFLQYLRNNNIDYDNTGMFDIWEGQGEVDEYDFVTQNGKKVDIKAAYKSNHHNLVINRQQFENSVKDFYVGVKLNAEDSPLDKKNLIIPNSITKGQIFGYAERDFLEGLEYVNPREAYCKMHPLRGLLDIKNLLKLF